MKHEVYFLQAANGGPIKIGTSGWLTHRASSFQGWLPGGVDLIASIPGDTFREAALKWALRDESISGEWVRSCPKAWRLILDAIDHGDLRWLPHPQPTLLGKGMGLQLMDGWEASFGGRAACAAALGYSAKRWTQVRSGCSWRVSPGVWGRWAIASAERAGNLPSYLARQPQPQQDAA